MKPAVLFLCVHNAGRSQMAAALLAREAGDRIAVYSAGSAPGETLNPAVVAALQEWDIDITGNRPQKFTDEMVQDASVIITMGCGDVCPVYPGKKYMDWALQDPAGQPIETVREIRDDILLRVQGLVADLLK
ncbi:MAG: arsenate reductase ArsC [Actinobacteria bacterium]|nr:arsenate reductase ArsC [Actinomycetota bacterium]